MLIRAELKEHAKLVMKNCYWKAVLVSVILGFVLGGGGSNASGSSQNVSNSIKSGDFSPQTLLLVGGITAAAMVISLAGIALSVFAWNPLEVGSLRFFTRSCTETGDLSDLAFAFKNKYMNVVLVQFLRKLFNGLWYMLLIVPGIIKAYEYRMIPYILAENPEIQYKDAFALSKQMMDGEKWNTFVLDLSFIGWNLLSLLTCFILRLFYVAPYQNLTNAELYCVLKQKVANAQTVEN